MFFCYLFFQHLVTLLLATVPTRDMIVSVQSLHFKRFLTLYFEIPVLVSSGLYNRRSYNILVCIDLFSIKSYPNMDAPLEQNPPALHLPRYVGKRLCIICRGLRKQTSARTLKSMHKNQT